MYIYIYILSEFKLFETGFKETIWEGGGFTVFYFYVE